MHLPIIKTYKPAAAKDMLTFYVLNKGKNAGRPSEAPNPNCFMLQCSSEEEYDHFFQLCYALWRGKWFHRHLIGSVIEFIRIGEFKSVLSYASEKISEKSGQLENSIKALKRLEDAEKAAEEQLKLIKRMRYAIAQQLMK